MMSHHKLSFKTSLLFLATKPFLVVTEWETQSWGQFSGN